MTMDQLKREVILRITQINENNINCKQAEELVKVAFDEFTGRLGCSESTELRLHILDEKYEGTS